MIFERVERTPYVEAVLRGDTPRFPGLTVTGLADTFHRLGMGCWEPRSFCRSDEVMRDALHDLHVPQAQRLIMGLTGR